MPEEPLFEVWVDGAPLRSTEYRVFRVPAADAERWAKVWRDGGHEAVVVPDQSKRPPDEEMLRDR